MKLVWYEEVFSCCFWEVTLLNKRQKYLFKSLEIGNCYNIGAQKWWQRIVTYLHKNITKKELVSKRTKFIQGKSLRIRAL